LRVSFHVTKLSISYHSVSCRVCLFMLLPSHFTKINKYCFFLIAVIDTWRHSSYIWIIIAFKSAWNKELSFVEVVTCKKNIIFKKKHRKTDLIKLIHDLNYCHWDYYYTFKFRIAEHRKMIIMSTITLNYH
jgi:hypothetical protein